MSSTFTFTYASVLQAKKMLTSLEGWLDKAVAYATVKSFDPETLLAARLAPDQFPLLRQIQSACDSAKFLAARLSGKDPPKHPDTEQTLEQVRARIRTVVAYLGTFQASDFDGAEARPIPLPQRGEGKTIKGADFVVEMGLPNFYFHVTTAYAILRHNGVDIGKRDYLGALSISRSLSEATPAREASRAGLATGPRRCGSPRRWRCRGTSFERREIPRHRRFSRSRWRGRARWAPRTPPSRE